MMVRVGFFSLEVVKQLPSVTKRFFTSRAWQWLLSTEVRGFFPMRIVPTSWLAKPVGALPKLGKTVPFMWNETSRMLCLEARHKAWSFSLAKMDDRGRDAIGIQPGGIDRDVIPVI